MQHIAYGRSTTQTKPSKLKPCNHAVLCPARHHFWAATVKLELYDVWPRFGGFFERFTAGVYGDAQLDRL